MSLAFEPITLERQQHYLARLRTCPQISSDYSFVNLWAWADTYGLRWAWDANLVWLKQTRPQELYWAPIGPWETIVWENVLQRLLTDCNTFFRIPEKLLRLWRNMSEIHFDVDDVRGHWDYLYNAEQLKSLTGNRFHKKKNLLNQFKKKYDYRYEPLRAETIPLATDMQTDWCEWRDCESSETLSAENQAIETIFNSWGKLEGLTGGTLVVDKTIAAYTVAEILTDETILIHFEKANPFYKGGYQAINQIFLAQTPEAFTLVNREQDLDDEGLRRAKLSYHPVDFIRKYTVRFA
ncbi:DUF2156 domain-containing protein [Thermodesulfobacteriota bacterium]